MEKTFRESLDGATIQAVGKDFDVVLIETGLSKNGFLYTEETLRKSVHLFEGSPINSFRFGRSHQDDFFNHVPDAVENRRPEGFSENLVGFVKDVKFGDFTRPDGTSGKGILGRLHILEGAAWLRQNLKDAFKNGRPDLLGLSINVEGMISAAIFKGQRVKKVESIKRVKSTEFVTEPSAGGSLLRLVASVQGEAVMDDLLKMIQGSFPQWLVAAKGLDQKEEGYLQKVLESNLVKAQETLKGIPITESKKLSEVGRGVSTLNSILGKVKEGKVQSAIDELKLWIEAAGEKKLYEFPVKASDDGGDGVTPPTPVPAPELAPAPAPAPVPPLAGVAPAGDPTPTDDGSKNKNEPKGDNVLTPEQIAKQKELDQKESELKVKEALLHSGLNDKGKALVQKILEGKTKIEDKDIKEAIDQVKEIIEGKPQTKTDPASGAPTGLGDGHTDLGGNTEIIQEERDKMVAGLERMLIPNLSEEFHEKHIDAEEYKRLKEAPHYTGMRDAFVQITKPTRYINNEDLSYYAYQGLAMAFPTSERVTCEKHAEKLKHSWNTMAPADLREAIVTADFPVLFNDAINKRLQKEYNRAPLNDWRKVISSIENLTDLTNQFSIIRIGGNSTFPTVPENTAYQELADTTESVETITPAKKGGLRKFTWEDALADRLGRLRAIPRVIGRAAARTVQFLVWDLIDTNAALVSDSVALVDAAHNNLISGNPTLAYVAVGDAIELLNKQKEQDNNDLLGLEPRFLLVGPDKQRLANEITGSDRKVSTGTEQSSTVRSFVNMKGVETLMSIALGRSTSPNTSKRWYVMASPSDAESIAVGFLGGRDRPDLFVQGMGTPTAGSFFDADAITFKTRFGVGVAAVDFRFIVGSLATT